MSVAAKKRGPVSNTTREKLSKLWKGRKHKTETKEKMSKVQSGENNAFFGKEHSNDSKKKIGSASKLRWEDPKYKEKMIIIRNKQWTNEAR